MDNYSYFNDKEANYTEYLIKEAIKKRYVLDTSVVAKWYYKKNESDLENASIIYNLLKSENNIFFAPDLLIYELLNIYRTKAELDNEKINRIILELYDLIVILGVSKNIFLKAFLNSRNLNISFYDSIYLALSKDLDAILVTADKKLSESAKETGRSVLMLSDFLK
ncbi:MAG: type II toxin-antitoxin system VapC family toxin [Actinobacteria bacterium]|nr:type II toxin-antitoxin system VapC family toxin [Actinomycetota bacterium]